MKIWWFALALAACSKHTAPSDPPSDPKPTAPTPVTADAAAPEVPAVDDTPTAGDEVTEMLTTGFLRIKDGKGTHEEQLPGSPRKHGEFPEGCYASADGAVYAVGKQYTGVDGPDDGVVWKRAPDGTWSTALRLELVQLASITGLAPDDIVTAGHGGYSWWNGKTWARTDLDESSFYYVWSDGKAIYGTDFEMTKTFKIVKGKNEPAPHSDHNWRDDQYACARGAVSYQVFETDKQIGKRKLSANEAAEIQGEVKDLKKQVEEHPENVRPANN
ncbi:MAG TPA: hypothetical protein VGM90_25975 [Kofleriaceae bacterium]|jgi:hypothetical protein